MLYWIKIDLLLNQINRNDYKGLYRPIGYFENGQNESVTLYISDNESLYPGKTYTNRFLGFYENSNNLRLIKTGQKIILKEGSVEIGMAYVKGENNTN